MMVKQFHKSIRGCCYKKYVTAFAKTVKGGHCSIVGVTGLDVDLNLISSMISNIKLAKAGYSAMLDSAGTIIAHKNHVILGNVVESSNKVKDSAESLAATTQQSNAVGDEVARAV